MTHIADTEVEIVQSGRVQVFEHYLSGLSMWSGSGDRDATVWVQFEKPFQTPPVVQLAPALMDASTDSYMRFDLSAQNIHTDGFDVVFKTWSDSKFARVAVSWIAIGNAMREEYRHIDFYS